jgi:hypothetical protein
LNSEPAKDEVFKEYKDLEPIGKSLEQHLILFFHLTAAVLISMIQFSQGLTAWFSGFGVLTPILLIIHGYFLSALPNDSWYREQMVPFILSIVTPTEIETDRYLQYHHRLNRFVLILGWPAILLCQITWTFGGTVILPAFVGNDLFIRFLGELLAYAVLFGPFLLYFLILLLLATILDRLMQSRYKDIMYLLDIENKWNKEKSRRAKDSKSMEKENTPLNNQLS